MPCNTGPPGAWAAAAAYNATKPKIRCPVVIGGDSILRTPEDLGDLCQLSSVPLVIQTTKTNLIPLPSEEEDDKNKVPVHISDVSVRQWLDLKKITEGKMIVIWFEGQRRYAWLAQSMRSAGPTQSDNADS